MSCSEYFRNCGSTGIFQHNHLLGYNFYSGKKILSLDFDYIEMVGSHFDINSMKTWIHPATVHAAAGGSVMMLGIFFWAPLGTFVSIKQHLNIKAFLRIIADCPLPHDHSVASVLARCT